MESPGSKQEIVICMGSSCFARGNGNHLATIKEYLNHHGLEATVRLSGLLCQDQCKVGPNIVISGLSYREVTSDRLIELLKQLGTKSRRRRLVPWVHRATWRYRSALPPVNTGSRAELPAELGLMLRDDARTGLESRKLYRIAGAINSSWHGCHLSCSLLPVSEP